MLKMAVTGAIKNYFIFWPLDRMIIDEIYFDNEFWCSMKNKFQKHYEHFFKGHALEPCFYQGTLIFGIKTFEA